MIITSTYSKRISNYFIFELRYAEIKSSLTFYKISCTDWHCPHTSSRFHIDIAIDWRWNSLALKDICVWICTTLKCWWITFGSSLVRTLINRFRRYRSVAQTTYSIAFAIFQLQHFWRSVDHNGVAKSTYETWSHKVRRDLAR